MTYYVRFKDNEEYVVCTPDQETAEEMTKDMQLKAGKTQQVAEAHVVADN